MRYPSILQCIADRSNFTIPSTAYVLTDLLPNEAELSHTLFILAQNIIFTGGGNAFHINIPTFSRSYDGWALFMCDTQAWALSVPQRNHLLVARASERERQQPETKISARCHKYRPSNIKVPVLPGPGSSVTTTLNFKIGNLPNYLPFPGHVGRETKLSIVYPTVGNSILGNTTYGK